MRWCFYMNIKTVKDINTITDDENNYDSIIQEINTNKHILVCYNPDTESLFVNEQDYAIIENLTESQLKELEHHIISCNDDKNVIYGFIKCDTSELRIFSKKALAI